MVKFSCPGGNPSRKSLHFLKSSNVFSLLYWPKLTNNKKTETGWQTFHGPIHNQQDLACQQIVHYVTFRTILVGCPKDVGFPFVTFGKSGVNLASYFFLLVVIALKEKETNFSVLSKLI